MARQRTGGGMFAAVWLVGDKYPKFEYYPYKSTEKDIPQINTATIFSPVNTPGQNYIVARHQDEQTHAEQVIMNQV